MKFSYTFLTELISSLLILLFVYTACSKLMTLDIFQLVISKSPLIGKHSTWLGYTVPITELIIATLLFIPYTKRLGFYLSTILMALFTFYIGYMLATVSNLPCSCGGVLKYMSWKQHLLFNIFFTALSLTAIMIMDKHKRIIAIKPADAPATANAQA